MQFDGVKMFRSNQTLSTLNSRTYTQTYTPTVVQEGGGERVVQPTLWIFVVLQYIGNILPLISTL